MNSPAHTSCAVLLMGEFVALEGSEALPPLHKGQPSALHRLYSSLWPFPTCTELRKGSSEGQWQLLSREVRIQK